MYAIAFDLVVSELKKHYGDNYQNAYAEIKKVLAKHQFYWIQGSTYATEGDLRVLFKAIESIKCIAWFCHCVRDIRAFKMEDYSDFTPEFHQNTHKK